MTQLFSIRGPLRSALIFLFLSFAVLSSQADAAVYALEIIAPRAGLTTANRYYKAYPGLVYDVDVAAIGGTYPYTYSLANAPSGMTINATTGRITWPSPTEQANPYPVSVTVRDSAGATASVSWSILVTTSGFRFVDAVNGRRASEGGDGSRANPWRSIADWYGNKYDTSSRGAFLYFRSGTYRTADAPIEDGIRMAMAGSNKPLVWLAYPGESPVIDTTNSHICIYTGSSNAYFDGFAIQNFNTNFGIRIDSNGNDVVFRNNRFSNLAAGWGGTGTNASALMIANGGSVGRYWSILNNQFQGVHDVGYGILGYLTNRTLVQGNQFSDFTVSQSKAIGPKAANSMWFIRDNRINISAGQGIWVDTYQSGSETTRDIEISYNLVKVGSGHALWIGQEPATYGEITSLRNSYIGARAVVDNLTSSNGPVSFRRDVIVNDTSAANKITTSGNVVTSELLTGSTSAGIVNSAGDLAGSYVQYVGTRGYQRAGTSSVVPMPPTALRAE